MLKNLIIDYFWEGGVCRSLTRNNPAVSFKNRFEWDDKRVPNPPDLAGTATVMVAVMATRQRWPWTLWRSSPSCPSVSNPVTAKFVTEFVNLFRERCTNRWSRRRKYATETNTWKQNWWQWSLWTERYCYYIIETVSQNRPPVSPLVDFNPSSRTSSLLW